MLNGRINVNNPKIRLLLPVDLNWFISKSNPAKNIIYNKPMVEKSLIDESFSSKPNPKGPIRTPDSINPMMPGMRNLRKTMGESKIINNINEKIKTGFVKGR